MEWIDPGFVVISVSFGAIAVFIGRWRKLPLLEIAMSTGGYFLFLWGLKWAGSFDRGAMLAAGAASLGTLLFAMADARRHRRRAASEAGSAGAPVIHT